MNDKKKWGRYFTKKEWLLDKIVNIIKHNNTFLEPCCGEGHIVKRLEDKFNNITCIDIIKSSQICKTPITFMNFFEFNLSNKYNTIITNPPYVSYRVFDNKIITNWKTCLPKTNLYLYFIEKCFHHLEKNGEMIFIIPIDFINNTRGLKLRELLFKNGTVTNIINLCDRKAFSDCSPDVIIIRYEKDNFSHVMNYQQTLESSPITINDYLYNGTYNFTNYNNFKYLKDFFNIKVGLVIGSNSIFEKDSNLSVQIIMSDYIITKKRKMVLYLEDLSLQDIKKSNPNIFNHLEKNKEQLINRKVRKCNENNWWKWGGPRNIKYMKNDNDCIFVNQRTRSETPFFIHKMSFFDGAVLCLIPKEKYDLSKWIKYLNTNRKLFTDHGLLINNKYMLNKIKLDNLKINPDLVI